MSEQFPPITINFTPVKVVGVPGLSLVAIVVAIAMQFPEARWLLLSGVAGGVVLAAALILVRRPRSRSNGPRDGILMRSDQPSTSPGRVVLPSSSRERSDLHPGSELEIAMGVRLRRMVVGPWLVKIDCPGQ